jgi:hypothetical protein
MATELCVAAKCRDGPSSETLHRNGHPTQALLFIGDRPEQKASDPHTGYDQRRHVGAPWGARLHRVMGTESLGPKRRT